MQLNTRELFFQRQKNIRKKIWIPDGDGGEHVVRCLQDKIKHSGMTIKRLDSGSGPGMTTRLHPSTAHCVCAQGERNEMTKWGQRRAQYSDAREAIIKLGTERSMLRLSKYERKLSQ